MKSMSFASIVLATVGLTFANLSFANAITIPMNVTADKGVGDSAGTVVVAETKNGLLFTPNLHGLTPGGHGFHVHQNASCEDNGMAAGGHFDPENTGKHRGPYDDSGHLGDLPLLTIEADGTVTTPVLAPRLRHLSDIQNHALMVHAGGDNYNDTPEKLGGGGARMVCGVIGS